MNVCPGRRTSLGTEHLTREAPSDALVQVESELFQVHQLEVLQLSAPVDLFVGVEHDAEWHGHVDCGLLEQPFLFWCTVDN